MSESIPAIDGATEPSHNLSYEELIAQRMERFSQQAEAIQAEVSEDEPEQTEEQPGDEPETNPEDTTEEAEELPDDEEAEDQGNEIDLLSLTPEQIQGLAKKGKSRLLHRIGELTAKSRHLEQQLAAHQAEAKPLQAPAIPAADNPFRDLTTIEQIRAKHAELEKVAEDTDRILEDHEDYGADDLITLGDKEFSKRQIRQANRNARDAMLKFLPAQHAEIVRGEQRVQLQAQFEQRIPEEVPEVADEEAPAGRLYKAMTTDPIIEQVRKHVPDLAPQLGYLLAHAARSIARSQAKPTQTKAAPGTAPKVKVPDAPAGAAAARSSAKPASKKAGEAYQQFEKTGSADALVAARIAKFQNL